MYEPVIVDPAEDMTRARRRLLMLLVGFMVLCIGGVLFVVTRDSIHFFPGTQTVTEAVDLGTASSVQADIQSGSAEMIVGDDSTRLLDATLLYAIDEQRPTIDYTINDERGLLVMRPGSFNGLIVGRTKNEWKLDLNPTTPLDLLLEASSGGITLAVDSTAWTALTVDVSSGGIEATLGGEHPALETMRLTTSSGGIEARLTGAFPALSRGHFETNSGGIELYLPARWSVEAELTVRADSGGITIVLPNTANLDISASADSGGVERRVWRWLALGAIATRLLMMPPHCA